MYTVFDYGRMAADRVRMDAYARAIARTVKPGSIVLDIGAGTGIFSLLAAKAGAKRVHAVDINPAVLLLSDLAKENGVEDLINVHHESSLELDLPERADVAISDLRGTTPLLEHHVRILKDARARLLKPDAALVPARDRLVVALVESDTLWNRLVGAATCFGEYGLTAHATESAIHNAMYTDSSSPLVLSDVLTNEEPWATLEYGAFDGTVLEGTVELCVHRGGFAHGLGVWFHATLVDGISYSTGPGHELAYRRAFFPLPSAITVRAGDVARVTVRADPTGERWAWDTEISGHRFRQATFLGMATSPEVLLKSSTSYQPTLSPRGQRARDVLGSFDGGRTVGELADGLVPSGVRSRDLAIEEVRDLVKRFAR